MCIMREKSMNIYIFYAKRIKPCEALNIEIYLNMYNVKDKKGQCTKIKSSNFLVNLLF